jgi:hypothetical protein
MQRPKKNRVSQIFRKRKQKFIEYSISKPGDYFEMGIMFGIIATKIQLNNLMLHTLKQGCQMVYFQNKSPNLVKFWRALEWKRLAYVFFGQLEYLSDIWYILWLFGNLVAIWYIFPHFGKLCQEKPGNPALSRFLGGEPSSQVLTNILML